MQDNLSGKSTLDYIHWIINQHPEIDSVSFKAYPPGHDPYLAKYFSLPREDFLGQRMLTEYMNNLKPDWNIGMSNRIVTLSGGTRYIPVADFSLSVSEENLELLSRRIHEVIYKYDVGPGVIIETGNSYHFLGSNLLDFESYLRFLGSSLLTSYMLPGTETYQKIIDERYIGHILAHREDYSAIFRLTHNAGKKQLRIVRLCK